MRFAHRLAQLERQLGRCPDCKPTIELVHDRSPARGERVEYCRSCEQPLEQIALRLAFDPNTGGEP